MRAAHLARKAGFPLRQRGLPTQDSLYFLQQASEYWKKQVEMEIIVPD